MRSTSRTPPFTAILAITLSFGVLAGACAGSDAAAEDGPAVCDGDDVLFPDGTRVECARLDAFCTIGEADEAICTQIQGGGPKNPEGTPRFLTLPLDYNAVVINGWQYNFANNGAGHYHGSIDFEASVGTPVYAACSGVAMVSSQYAKGKGYGRFVIIRCDAKNTNGEHYYALNAHVSEAEDFLPERPKHDQQFQKWAPITQGDLIAKSGKEDTSWPHLHFEVQQGSYAGPSVDAYDLYATTTSANKSAEQEYPPAGSRYTGCGPNFLWTQCPPVVAKTCSCSGSIASAQVSGEILHISGSISCSGGIEKWSIAAHDKVILTKPEGGQMALNFSESIDLASFGFADSDAPIGLWALENGQDKGCLVDDALVNLGGGGCDGAAGTKCIGGDVHHVDECGNSTGTSEACQAGATCVQLSPTQAVCQAVPDTCGNGVIDPQEQCDGAMFGGKTCADFGWPEGTLTCSQACTISTAQCCECTSGPCCDGCALRHPSTVCQPGAETSYDCSGVGCGADVTVRNRDRFCSGTSPQCSGDFGPWSAPTVYDDCSASETCTPGDSTCNADIMCMACTYGVMTYQCQTFSTANGTGDGGGEIFRICSSINSQTGEVTVKVRKHDGTTFGNRPYRVQVSNPQDPSCGPSTHYFTVSNDKPSGVGTQELTFNFQSLWSQGQTQKGYCVTASTVPNDPGYNANNSEQKSWWWSEKTIVTRACP